MTNFYTIILKIRDDVFHTEFHRYRVDIEAESEEEAGVKAVKMWKESHSGKVSKIYNIDVDRHSDTDPILYHQLTDI